MKRIVSLVILGLLLLTLIMAWLVFGPITSFSDKSRYFIVSEQADKAAVLQQLTNEGILTNTTALSLTGTVLGSWKKLRPGKYEVTKGSNAFQIARMLKNGRLASIKLVINKLRTKEDLARLIGKNFSTDSASAMRFFSSNDSLHAFAVDTNSLFTRIIPDTYLFYWNTPVAKMMQKITDNSDAFWQKHNRLSRANTKGLSKEQVYTLASIVEEETNFEGDKYKIASVYLNRLHKSMPLQACPTIKYAMKDFTLTRIYEKYLNNPSPYNTYRKAGLPPGPICTPSPKTIDIVLDAPTTDYLFFVAKSDFSGYHHFSSDYATHDKYAKAYQKALDAYMLNKQTQQKP